MIKHEVSSYRGAPSLSCRVYASLGSMVDTAAVFVHGFRGDEERTWREFQKLIDEDSNFASWDVYFVGYPSAKESIAATAYSLTKLIYRIYPEPPQNIFERYVRFAKRLVQLREAPTLYRRLVMIGHSQGGVVIRKTILEDAKDALRGGTFEDSPLCKADLVLFAPAMFGMLVSGWKGFAAETSAWKLAAPILGTSPSFKELQPGSQFLSTLRNETEGLAHDSPGKVAALSARIVWAARDGVVQGGLRYSCDPAYAYIDADHCGVCKPNLHYDAPLRFVLGRELD